MLTRRQFITGCFGTLTLGVGAFAYTSEIEPFWVQMVRRTLPVRDLPANLVGKRLVHLSDTHVGERVPDDFIVREFERVAALRPDVLVMTGDLTQASGASHAAEVFSHLPHGTLATVCVLGNHDYGRGWSEPDKADRLTGVLRNEGITVLRNDVIDVEGLQIIGMDDLWARRFHPEVAFAKADSRAPAICLSHNPDSADVDGWGDFDGWILAGHTHGGQCKPPFLPPPRSVVANKRYVAGEYELEGGRRMYINRGLGFVNQLRFNARPEISVFELVRA